VLYTRAARLFDELQVAHGDGSFGRRLAQLAKLDLLVPDDFAISPIGAAERNDLLEVLDDRVGTRSTLITSQLPVKAWHTYGMRCSSDSNWSSAWTPTAARRPRPSTTRWSSGQLSRGTSRTAPWRWTPTTWNGK
jgi:hypothetical protein